MSNTEWRCDVDTATLSDADKLVNDGGNQGRAFDDLTEVGSGLAGLLGASIASTRKKKRLKSYDVKGGFTVSDAIGKLTAEGKHIRDVFGLDIHDDLKPSRDLLADADSGRQSPSSAPTSCRATSARSGSSD